MLKKYMVIHDTQQNLNGKQFRVLILIILIFFCGCLKKQTLELWFHLIHPFSKQVGPIQGKSGLVFIDAVIGGEVGYTLDKTPVADTIVHKTVSVSLSLSPVDISSKGGEVFQYVKEPKYSKSSSPSLLQTRETPRGG